MSVPIAVAPTRLQQDYSQGYLSFSPRNVLHGSPMSLKTGSFQNRFYPGGSPGHSLGPIAMPDFKLAPSSDAGAWLKAVHDSSSVSDDDLCRNYVCCGVALADLHALVEHFESHHVEVIWPAYDSSSSPDSSSPDGTPAFDADDMDISEPSPSPPATPAQSAFDSVRVDVAMSACFRAPSQYTSSYSSLAGANGPQAAFNRYAGYADYSSALPGTDPSPTYDAETSKQPQAPVAACVPPALLYSNSASPSPLTTPACSRTGTPSPVLPLHPHSSASAAAAASVATTSKRNPAASLTLTKPFRCPKPGCNKSYKQQNGLKYHLSHGQCNFAPRDPAVEALSEAEREKRLRPFVCAVGALADCGRRYKNMNGLRYHYTHTGEHGARGLEMLAQGQHPLPDGPPSSQNGSPAPTPAPQSVQPRYFPPHPVSTVPVPAPVALAPSPLSPFPTRVAWDD